MTDLDEDQLPLWNATAAEVVRDYLEHRQETGQTLKDAGMVRALNAAEEWRADALDALWAMASTGLTFTSEDLVEIVGLPRGGVATNRNNAVGAVMNGAARRGWIRKTGRRVLSRRGTSHAAELTEWVGGT